MLEALPSTGSDQWKLNAGAFLLFSHIMFVQLWAKTFKLLVQVCMFTIRDVFIAEPHDFLLRGHHGVQEWKPQILWGKRTVSCRDVAPSVPRRKHSAHLPLLLIKILTVSMTEENHLVEWTLHCRQCEFTVRLLFVPSVNSSSKAAAHLCSEDIQAFLQGLQREMQTFSEINTPPYLIKTSHLK